MVNDLVARLIEQRARASSPDEEDAADHRLREIRQVASRLFQEDFRKDAPTDDVRPSGKRRRCNPDGAPRSRRYRSCRPRSPRQRRASPCRSWISFSDPMGHECASCRANISQSRDGEPSLRPFLRRRQGTDLHLTTRFTSCGIMSMKTAYILAAQYERAVIPVEVVARDYFGGLDKDTFLRKVGAGENPAPCDQDGGEEPEGRPRRPRRGSCRTDRSAPRRRSEGDAAASRVRGSVTAASQRHPSYLSPSSFFSET